MITVESVVRQAAQLIGVEDRTDAYFDGNTAEENLRVVEGLVNCFNLVENELAVDYLPLFCEETLLAEDGRIAYGSFSKKAARVISVYDEWGNCVRAKRMPTHLEVPSGKYVVRYAALPEEKSVEGSSDYEADVTVRLLAYGVAAEYCLHKGMYEEHAAWDKKYRDAIGAAVRTKGAGSVKVRCWV